MYLDCSSPPVWAVQAPPGIPSRFIDEVYDARVVNLVDEAWKVGCDVLEVVWTGPS
jgi:hypothetical protein